MNGSPVRLFPFQREPLDIIVNPSIRKTVFVSSAQILKTSILTYASYYLMQNNPSNMLHASITGEMKKKYKTGVFEQGIKQCSVLENLVTRKTDKNAVNDQNQIKMKDGTMIYFASLGAPATLRSVTTKYLFLDEISGAVETEEGDPIALANQRAASFADSLIMSASTPVHPTDPVMVEWSKSDQRKYFVPCPHCNHEHEIVWANVRFTWTVDPKNGKKIALSKGAKLHCPKCDKPFTEAQRHTAVANGRWIATRPEVTDYAGFHISRLYSPLTTIEKIVQDFSDSFANFDLQTFYNTSLRFTI